MSVAVVDLQLGTAMTHTSTRLDPVVAGFHDETTGSVQYIVAGPIRRAADVGDARFQPCNRYTREHPSTSARQFRLLFNGLGTSELRQMFPPKRGSAAPCNS
jgi:hypothetical protein